jgi:hypothetical protein
LWFKSCKKKRRTAVAAVGEALAAGVVSAVAAMPRAVVAGGMWLLIQLLLLVLPLPL